MNTSKIGWYGLPRQHSDVGLWLFPNRLIILVYVRFDILLVFPPAFIKVRPRSVGYVTIYTVYQTQCAERDDESTGKSAGK